MRIGIDCRTVLGHKTGDRTYALNLLRGLAELSSRGVLPTGWTFHLLVDQPDNQGILPATEALQPVVLPAPRNSGRLWTGQALPTYARQASLDLVHLQYIAPPNLPCPYITTVHDVVWKALPQTFPLKDRLVMNALMPGTVKRAARVITGSESSRQGIARYLPIRQNQITVTTYAIDPVFQKPVSAEQIAEVRRRYHLGDTPYVLSVGVLQPRKNVPRLIEAFEAVKRTHPEWPHHLVIVGKQGWGKPTITGEVASWLLTTGYVADEELPALYHGAEVFGYPSLYEGFGLPVLEAMACGTPVLSSNVTSLPEVAGDAALLVNPLSVVEMTAALERLLGDAALREDLRHKGRARAKHFTPEQQARETLEVYKSVL